MSRASEYAANAARILQAKGDAIAQGHLTRGNIIGSTIATLGQVIPQQVQEVMKRNAEKRKTEQIHGILGKYPNDLGAAANEIMAIDRDLGTKLLEQNMQAKKFAMETAKFDDDMKQRKQSMLLKPFLTATTEDEWDQARLNARVAGVDKDIPYAAMPWSPDLPKRMLLDQMSPEKRYEALYPDAPKAPDPFTLSEGQTRFGPDGTVIANVPKPPGAQEGGFTLSPGARRYDAQGNVIATAPNAPTGGGGNNDAEYVEAVMSNPALWQSLTPTVKTRIGPKLAARGFTQWSGGVGGGKPSTQSQKRDLGFFNRAKQADTDLKSIEAEIAKMGLAGQGRLAFAPNFLQTQVGQLYDQSQRAFTEARLRKDSGAAIPPHEFANDRKTYFVQPGDTAKTIEQKNRARAAMLASLGFSAGPALQEFYGDDAASIIDDYKAQSSASGTTTTQGSNTALAELERRRRARGAQ